MFICLNNLLEIDLISVRNGNVMLFHHMACNLIINGYYLMDPGTITFIASALL